MWQRHFKTRITLSRHLILCGRHIKSYTKDKLELVFQETKEKHLGSHLHKRQKQKLAKLVTIFCYIFHAGGYFYFLYFNKVDLA